MNDLEAILRWYTVLTLIGIGLAPIVRWLGRGLGPLAFGLVRPLALVILTWLVWWPAATMSLPFSRPILISALAIVAAGGWYHWYRTEFAHVDLRAWLVFEFVWAAFFVVYAGFRSYNPDIAYTEKPMEIALLSSVSQSSAAPAPDPWFAGSAINYYYFGYQTLATVIKLSGVPAVIGFNLGLATLFASCATCAAAIAGQIARRCTAGRRWVILAAAVAPVLLLLAGNLETAHRLIDDRQATIDAGWWDGVGWQASRVIVDHGVHEASDVRETINEFPAFSFVLGDLHPHVLTYPLFAAVLALALGLAPSGERLDRLRLSAVGGLVGLLYASNSWDAPAGFLVVATCIALGWRGDWRQTATDIACVAGGAIVAALPFVVQFDAPLGVASSDVPSWISDLPILGTFVNTFGVVGWRPSSVSEVLTVHGLWIAVFVAFAASEASSHPYYRGALSRRRHLVMTGGALLFAVAFAWAPAVVFIGVPMLAATWIALRSTDPGSRSLSALFAIGFGLALIPEFFYIQDVFADRMNTVFKLYFQAWLILSAASAAAFVVAIRRIGRTVGAVIGVAGAVGMIAALTYTPLSAQDWTNDFAERRGLNGMEYIDRANAGDFAAIEWLREHASDGDTIVESPGCSYDVVDGVPMNRISAFTGLPTRIGWSFHEYQWRRGQIEQIDPVLSRRVQEANSVLSGSGDASVYPRFLILGHQETLSSSTCPNVVPRDLSASDALRDAGWVEAFAHETTRVYVRADDAIATALR